MLHLGRVLMEFKGCKTNVILTPPGSLLHSITHPFTHLSSIFTPPPLQTSITVGVCNGLTCSGMALGVVFVHGCVFAWLGELLLTAPSVAIHPFCSFNKLCWAQAKLHIPCCSLLSPQRLPGPYCSPPRWPSTREKKSQTCPHSCHYIPQTKQTCCLVYCLQIQLIQFLPRNVPYCSVTE